MNVDWPKALRKYVGTVPVWLKETAFGFVPLQLGKLDVEVTQLSVGVGVPESVTPDTGLAAVQALTAAVTVVLVALAADSA